MTAPTAVIDALNSLLEAELNSIFRFMGESSPYLGRAGAEIRRPLAQMVQGSHQHASELDAMVESLGGFPTARSLQNEEQYLAFLSLKFLLPKLVDAKQLMIRRYENVIAAIPGAPPEVLSLLNGQLSDHRLDLQILHDTTAAVLAKK